MHLSVFSSSRFPDVFTKEERAIHPDLATHTAIPPVRIAAAMIAAFRMPIPIAHDLSTVGWEIYVRPIVASSPADITPDTTGTSRPTARRAGTSGAEAKRPSAINGAA